LNKQDIKNLPTSIHDRLLNQARTSGRPFNELLQYYAIERFLYRLSRSPYANQFVLKGALLFRVWGLQAFRPTRDIDLLGHTSNEMDNLVGIIREVCLQKVQDDGMFFDPETISGERIKEDADYEGVRVRFVGLLGKTRVHIQIDVGFADVVSPAPMKVKYPVILQLPEPELHSYPPESVVAEKLQAMIYLGSINSRMKDFYDVWIMANQFEFSGSVLQEAIRQTFENRKTAIPMELPTAFSEQFAREKQTQWKAFLKTSGITDVPDRFNVVQDFLREFLLPIFQSLRVGNVFTKNWRNSKGWE
jgi:hypothetical protein